MTPSETLQAYLIQTTRFKRRLGLRIPQGFHYHGPEDYVLDHGDPFTSQALTPEELALVMAATDNAGIRFQLRWCFYNAQKLVLSDTTYTLQYCEGLAIGMSGLPVLHGWATLNGKVIDLTWRQHTTKRQGRLRDRVFGEIPPYWAYTGVQFNADSIEARWALYGSACSILDDFEHGFPIFQEPRLRNLTDILSGTTA